MRLFPFILPALFASSALAQQPATPKKLDSFEIQRAHLMLKQAHDEILKNYYDPTFHGVDFEKAYQAYDARLDSATSINDCFRTIAAFVMILKDSHTTFIPPARQNRSTPGFVLEPVGDKIFVTRIRPNTDAASKLHVGDQVLAFNGYKVTRPALHEMKYIFQTLSPAPTEAVDILNPSNQAEKEVIKATIRPGKPILDLASDNDADYWKLVRDEEGDDHLNRERFYENGDTMIWKMPGFDVEPKVVNDVMAKALKHKTLILDLRGNPGGYVDTLKELIGRLFDHDIKMGDEVSRKGSKPMIAKSHGTTFKGDLIVLIDSGSASCSEVFARVIQLEKRGKIIGDTSAGAVMEALHYHESVGGDYVIYYGLSITSANIVMTDGKSLEKVGVTPDEIILPTGQDLASSNDPVLAHAADLTGAHLDAEAAGKLFPYEWSEL